MATKVWGVNSSEKVTEALLRCVKRNFGYPKFWGRVLSQVEGLSEGLTTQEIQLIHERSIKVMPIFKSDEVPEGFDKGRVFARNALYHARRLSIPKDTAIFVDVHRFMDVDEAFVYGWIDSIISTGYIPGFLNDSTKGQFSESYCRAVKKKRQIATQSILWSAEPEIGTSQEKTAPNFTPHSPPCKANIWAWQYGRETGVCQVNTVLADRKLLPFLY
ncbi:glycoside hydrolase family 25 domain-containing protein [Sutcliffiella rhizosphaerae]|uniref:DUF1906 domain-containing protein n=1 Tax=Sutcliffiella rhizosphaerae TaxID=2880967 RepID=A0ABN8A4B2_9BACI|nr:hypothetical protein [Sutcliffiella rhizosphaerae]CAG9619920.1 hypothetical protein BACCIP111883_00688 [Sutcliffiella rhizosphaerae]